MAETNPDPTLMTAQFVWKTPQMMRAAVIIARTALAAPAEFWPDECDFSPIADADRNCIGNTFKALIRVKLIRKTGAWRGSSDKSTGRKGRIVFAYEVTAVAALRELLGRYDRAAAVAAEPQMNLAV